MENESLITVEQAAKLIPCNPSPVTVWRWMRRGVKSRTGRVVRLRHVRFGARLFTTAADVKEFADELARADAEHFKHAAPDETRRQWLSRESRRSAEVEGARVRMKAAGIG